MCQKELCNQEIMFTRELSLYISMLFETKAAEVIKRDWYLNVGWSRQDEDDSVCDVLGVEEHFVEVHVFVPADHFDQLGIRHARANTLQQSGQLIVNTADHISYVNLSVRL